MTPRQFIDTWRSSDLKENAGGAAALHGQCRMLDEPIPHNPENYCFEKPATKDSGARVGPTYGGVADSHGSTRARELISMPRSTNGWKPDIGADEALAALLALNKARSRAR